MLLVQLLAAILLADPVKAVGEGRELYRHGNYEEAIEKFRSATGGGPVAAAGIARCLHAVGKYEEGVKTLEESIAKNEDSADLRAILGQIHFDRGRYPQALAEAEQALGIQPKHLEGRWLRARALIATGKFEEANKELAWFVEFYNEAQPTAADDLVVIAAAVSEYCRWNQAPDEFDFILNTLLADAEAADADNWRVPYTAGSLLVDKYNKKDGVPKLRTALTINPSAVDALVALGRSAIQEYDVAEANRLADQALEINPKFVDAMQLKADALAIDGRIRDSAAILEKSLETNPIDERSLGRLAACRQLLNELDKAIEIERTVRATNPKPGLFYAASADFFDDRRQFELAERGYRRAIELAPHLTEAWNGLGIVQMNVGKENEARATFAEARKRDPFHQRVFNFVKVLEHLEQYKILRSEHYEVYVRPDVDLLLGKYALAALEDEHENLCKRFGYHPEERTKIEFMVDHKWFSARVAGVPSIGIVGACTGNVVALASPRSLKQPFNWAQVLRHEVTHIITLQQTNYNIPHWFTEALAVQTEGFGRPAIWDQLLVERVPKGELFNLDNINLAFARPKTQLDWQFAYCQSLLYAECIIAKYGQESIHKLLASFRDGLEIDVAIKQSLGVEKKQLEAEYRDYLKQVVAGLKTGPTESSRSFAEVEKAVRAEPNNPDLLADLAIHYWKRKDVARARQLADKALEIKTNHPVALYLLARLEASIGKNAEAIKLLEPAIDAEKPNDAALDLLAGLMLQKKDFKRALELYEAGHKAYPGDAKWLEGIARIQLQTDDRAGLAKSLERLAAIDSSNLAVRKKLAELAFERKDWERAAHWAKESIYIDVNEPLFHRVRGEAALELKNFPLAVEELEVALLLAPKAAQTPLLLARAYRDKGDVAKARELLENLKSARPNDRELEELLKSLPKP